MVVLYRRGQEPGIILPDFEEPQLRQAEQGRAFDAYVPDKMSHRPVMFLRAPDTEEWVRIYGLVSTRELMEEYQKLLED